MADTYDISIKQGATFRLAVTYKIDGVPVDMTGFSARMQLRPAYDSKLLVTNLTSAVSGGLTIDDEDGRVNILIPAEKTANITTLEGVYDLEVVNPSGEVIRLLSGKFTLSREVTR